MRRVRPNEPAKLALPRFTGYERRLEIVEFPRWLLGEGRLAAYVEASTDRFLPAMPELTQTPFWRDPNRSTVIKIIESNLPPQLLHDRVDWRLAEETVAWVWPKAVTRIALDGWTAEQAADEAIARVEQIVGQ